MPVKANLYYHIATRELEVDYDMTQTKYRPYAPLILRYVNSEDIHNFIIIIHTTYPNFKDPNYLPLPPIELMRLYNHLYGLKLRIKRIHIKLPDNVVVIEKSFGDFIPPGTRFFCGMCGEAISQSTESLEFPFDHLEWKQKTRDHAYTHFINGMKCKHCENILGTQEGFYDFVSLYEFLDNARKKLRRNAE